MINKIDIIHNTQLFSYPINLIETDIIGINTILSSIPVLYGSYSYSYADFTINLHGNTGIDNTATLYYNGIGYTSIGTCCNVIDVNSFLIHGQHEIIGTLGQLVYLIPYTGTMVNAFVNEIENSANNGYYSNYIIKLVQGIGIQVIYNVQPAVGQKINFNYLIIK